MDDLLESAVREVEELAASVDFELSEISDDELNALPSPTDDADGVEELSQVAPGEAQDPVQQPETVDQGGSELAAANTPRGVAWLDRVLTVLNQPFSFLSQPARRWLGLIAAVTLGVSVLFAVLKPLFLDDRDLISELRASAARIEQADRESTQ